MRGKKGVLPRFSLIVTAIALVMGLINVPLFSSSNAQAREDNKVLIVYYSRSGNTQFFAEQIQQSVGGDILRLQTVSPYPSEYRATTEQAKKELEAGFKPPLQPINIDLSNYDTIYLGSPCWWGTIAPPVMTFLYEHDFSGKTVIPFSTHEGTGIGRTVPDIRKFAPNATVLDGLAIRGGNIRNAQSDINSWLQKIGQI